ncbi:hypothetical protein N7462_001435 [Penicillium macrosclerotiorum]|uniref:uncharacterized protein n=1 Tax=Penicillium macrosclerotiorum TaxID=303699 RepID=UPI002546BA53|nr:uncharacterized protein N7462_001435 [Penicillium macrosclerotiorum]KAJ5692012.1 hypothetical protein N7462_001435 [Penicillium macrosclerotiorum]
MHFETSTRRLISLYAICTAVCVAKDFETFSVNRLIQKNFMTMGRMDPIIDPGMPSGHVHAIEGGNKFNLTMGDEDLLSSTCTSASVDADKSNYWTPALYFQDPNTGKFTAVEKSYMNVYYFFEATDDEIKAFPPGLRFFVGDVSLREPPKDQNGKATGAGNTDPNKGPIQPVQWTCPRVSYNPRSWPEDSDGMHGVGIQAPGGEGVNVGAGFPDRNCDAEGSPLRADIHFPSCYNPKKGLRDYKNNFAWASSEGTEYPKVNCPEGYMHLPHMFYEVYWHTDYFARKWTEGNQKQPFVLANGDRTGYSLHADFIAGWEEDVLQTIIDTCDTQHKGMQACPNAGSVRSEYDNSNHCIMENLVPEKIDGTLDQLPGDNPVTGWD